MIRVLLFVLALFVACDPAVSYRPDTNFTPSERAEIQRAADAWNAFLAPDSHIRESDDWLIVKDVPPSGSNGECSAAQRVIWIHPEHPGATVYEVALHELGHALGLEHTTTGLMMPFTVSAEFTPEVLAECRRVGACRPPNASFHHEQ